jgi:alpha-mannosidase
MFLQIDRIFTFQCDLKVKIKYQVNDANLVVQDSSGSTIAAQCVGLDNVTGNLRNFYTRAYLGLSSEHVPKYWLLFQASVPPLGWNTYFISKASGKGIHI